MSTWKKTQKSNVKKILTLVSLIVLVILLLYVVFKEKSIAEDDFTFMVEINHSDGSSYSVDLRHYEEEVSYRSCNALTGVARMTCFSDLALKTDNPSECDNLDGETRAECISNYALKNPDTCSILDVSSLESFDCYSGLALFYKDISYCENLLDEEPLYLKSACQVNLAQETLDEGVCASILNHNFRYYCYAVLNAEMSTCMKIDKSVNLGAWIKQKCIDCTKSGSSETCSIVYDYDSNSINIV